MSQYCRPKKRTTFRRQRMSTENMVHPIGYPDPAMKWKMLRSMVKAILQSNNAVLKEKAS